MSIELFEYDGNTFEVDTDQAKTYPVIRGLAMAEKDPIGFFNAMYKLFNGHDAEYIELVGNDHTKELIAKALEVANSKNS